MQKINFLLAQLSALATISARNRCGCSSVVEHFLAKEDVARSNRVTRSSILERTSVVLREANQFACGYCPPRCSRAISHSLRVGLLPFVAKGEYDSHLRQTESYLEKNVDRFG